MSRLEAHLEEYCLSPKDYVYTRTEQIDMPWKDPNYRVSGPKATTLSGWPSSHLGRILRSSISTVNRYE